MQSAKMIHEADQGDAWIKQFSQIMVDLGWTQEIIPDTQTADKMGFEGLYISEELTASKLGTSWKEYCEENGLSPEGEFDPFEEEDDYFEEAEYDYYEEKIDLDEEWAYFQGEDEYPDWEDREY